MHLTLQHLIKLLAAGGAHGVAHLIGNPGLTVSDDALELWDAVVESVQADQELVRMLEIKKGS